MESEQDAFNRSMNEAGGWMVALWDALAAPVRTWRSQRRTESNILMQFRAHTDAEREQHDRTGVCPICSETVLCRSSALIAIDVVALITERNRDEIARFIDDYALWRTDWQTIATAMQEQITTQE